MSTERYTPAKRRQLEAARLAWLDGELRRYAAMTLEAYLDERRTDDTVVYLEEDRAEWAAGHAALVAQYATA